MFTLVMVFVVSMGVVVTETVSNYGSELSCEATKAYLLRDKELREERSKLFIEKDVLTYFECRRVA